jgi:hypothetical protein
VAIWHENTSMPNSICSKHQENDKTPRGHFTIKEGSNKGIQTKNNPQIMKNIFVGYFIKHS